MHINNLESVKVKRKKQVAVTDRMGMMNTGIGPKEVMHLKRIKMINISAIIYIGFYKLLPVIYKYAELCKLEN
jgi:hypothetical protein